MLADDDLFLSVDAVNLNTFLAISRPIVVICMWTALLCDSRNEHLTGNALLGAGVVHHINRVILQCRKTKSLFRAAPMRDATDLPIEA